MFYCKVDKKYKLSRNSIFNDHQTEYSFIAQNKCKKEQMQHQLHLLFFAHANENGCPYSTRVLTKVKTGDAMGDKDRYAPIRR